MDVRCGRTEGSSHEDISTSIVMTLKHHNKINKEKK